jgi:hypothetical protein
VLALPLFIASSHLLVSAPAFALQAGQDSVVPRSTAEPHRKSDKGQSATRGGEGKGDEGKGEKESPDTEDMFGFTVGTDVIEKGHIEVSGEVVSSLGKRFGHYQADAFRSTFTFSPIEGVSIEPGVIGHHFSIRNVSGLQNRSFTGFEGLSAEIKLRVLKRDPSPFGLTLLAQPRMGFLEEDTGVRGRGQGLETRLLLDTALIPNTVYAGLNGIYEMDKFRPRGITLFGSDGTELEGPALPCGPTSDVNLEVNPEDHTHTTFEGGRLIDMRHVHTDGSDQGHNGADTGGGNDCATVGRRKSAERSSKLGISGALAFQAIPNVFLGGEVRYLRAYDGLTLQHFRGEAVFVGPTLNAKVTDHLAISAAFSTQVAGHAVGLPGQLDLDNFPRYQARLKIFYEF